jgi:hypothetical protein
MTHPVECFSVTSYNGDLPVDKSETKFTHMANIGQNYPRMRAPANQLTPDEYMLFKVSEEKPVQSSTLQVLIVFVHKTDVHSSAWCKHHFGADINVIPNVGTLYFNSKGLALQTKAFWPVYARFCCPRKFK